MLRSMKDLEGYAIGAIDGTIGRVTDFYFDDQAWVVRYLVVDTGSWLSSRKVLISPIAIVHPNWEAKVLPVSITQEQVKNSPEIDTDLPVSRQQEIRYLAYYGYPFYWGGGTAPSMMVPGYVGFESTPHAVERAEERTYAHAEAARHQNDDPHLRSCKTIIGYHIEANDGDIGHLQGLLVDEESWVIRYLAVHTSNWWLGHDVVIAPQRIKDVSWSDATVSVNLSRQAVKDAPAHDPTSEPAAG